MSLLSPVFNDEQLDNNGDPLVGGQVIFYLAGTSTVTNTYTDSTGATAHPSPIVLNTRGEVTGSIWLTEGRLYKARLFDASGVLIREFDNISAINDTSITTGTSGDIEWTGTLSPVYLSATSFSVAGDQTAILAKYRRTRSVVSGGIVYGTITSATYGSGITTIVQTNDSIPLDSGLSSFQYGILSPVNKSYLPSVPSGSVVVFYQASASLGWTQVTNRNNRFLRVVNSTGGAIAGVHSPIIMNLVPNHTHTFTTGTESNDHVHTYVNPNASTSAFGAGVTNAVPGTTAGANTGGVSATHTHSGTTNSNAGTNWEPLYMDVIIASKD